METQEISQFPAALKEKAEQYLNALLNGRATKVEYSRARRGSLIPIFTVTQESKHTVIIRDIEGCVSRHYVDVLRPDVITVGVRLVQLIEKHREICQDKIEYNENEYGLTIAYPNPNKEIL